MFEAADIDISTLALAHQSRSTSEHQYATIRTGFKSSPKPLESIHAQPVSIEQLGLVVSRLSEMLVLSAGGLASSSAPASDPAKTAA